MSNSPGAKFESMQTTNPHSKKVGSERSGHIMDIGMSNSPVAKLGSKQAPKTLFANKSTVSTVAYWV